jgi:hypothetical protein
VKEAHKYCLSRAEQWTSVCPYHSHTFLAFFRDPDASAFAGRFAARSFILECSLHDALLQRRKLKLKAKFESGTSYYAVRSPLLKEFGGCITLMY